MATTTLRARLGKQQAQLAPPAVQARNHCSNWSFHHRGDFLALEPVDIGVVHRGAELLRQRVHRGDKALVAKAFQRLIFRR